MWIWTTFFVFTVVRTLSHSSFWIPNCRCSRKSFDVHFIFTNPQLNTYICVSKSSVCLKIDELKLYQQQFWGPIKPYSYWMGQKKWKRQIERAEERTQHYRIETDLATVTTKAWYFKLRWRAWYYFNEKVLLPDHFSHRLSGLLSLSFALALAAPWAIRANAAESWFWLFNDVPHLFISITRL